MRVFVVVLLLIAAFPVLADDTVVLQVVNRDLDRDGVVDHATLVRRGDRHYVIVEKAGVPAAEGRREILIHPQVFSSPKLVYSEYARYLMVGESGVHRKGWILWTREGWGMLADSRSGIDDPPAR